jgi:hypothetical protein
MAWRIGFILFALPAYAEFGFDETYERNYGIFNPLNQYRPGNPLNPINSDDPNNPLDPINRYTLFSARIGRSTGQGRV